MRKVGITKYDESEKSRLISKEKPFHDPIKRNKVNYSKIQQLRIPSKQKIRKPL